MKAFGQLQYSSTVYLNAGQNSCRVINNDMGGGKPVCGRGDVMNQGASKSMIFAVLDWTTLNPSGGVFNFTAPIPSDGMYILAYTFSF